MHSRLIALSLASLTPGEGVLDHAVRAADAQRQAEVAALGASVMPFALDRTMHRFAPDAQGGVQSVVSTDRDPEQIRSIRAHLRDERERFVRGDYSSPAAIHGASMPGLATLVTARGRLEVEYADLPEGGALRFRTLDASLVAAVHDWFAAQSSDHGRHAEHQEH